jgi:hypothetical protein
MKISPKLKHNIAKRVNIVNQPIPWYLNPSGTSKTAIITKIPVTNVNTPLLSISKKFSIHTSKGIFQAY